MNAAIVDDGIPDDLGQSGLGVITDSNAQKAYRIEWELQGRKFVFKFEEPITAAEVAALLGRRDERTA